MRNLVDSLLTFQIQICIENQNSISLFDLLNCQEYDVCAMYLRCIFVNAIIMEVRLTYLGRNPYYRLSRIVIYSIKLRSVQVEGHGIVTSLF